MYDAIILAGGENGKNLHNYVQQPYEAMIVIADRPMVTFVAQALSKSPHVGRIFVLGPARELSGCDFPANTVVMQGGSTIMDTIMIGMRALGHQEKVIVATADIPLLTPAAIDDFIKQCERVEADLYYPIVTKKVNDRHYPGNKRTYVHLQEGTYTGGNIFLVNPKVVPNCIDIASRIYDHRKNPLKLCQLLGWSFVFKFIFRRLHLALLEKRVSKLLHLKGAVIQSTYPELGIDVDKPSDLDLVRTIFTMKSGM